MTWPKCEACGHTMRDLMGPDGFDAQVCRWCEQAELARLREELKQALDTRAIGLLQQAEAKGRREAMAEAAKVAERCGIRARDVPYEIRALAEPKDKCRYCRGTGEAKRIEGTDGSGLPGSVDILCPACNGKGGKDGDA